MAGHAFLFEEGYWSAEGCYWDEFGLAAPYVGSVSFSDVGGYMVMESQMRVVSQPPIEIENRYEIMPLSTFRNTSTWTAYSSVFGNLAGVITLVAESILSEFRSDDGKYIGFEFFVRLGPETYRNEGALFEGRRRNAAWAVVLKRAT